MALEKLSEDEQKWSLRLFLTQLALDDAGLSDADFQTLACDNDRCAPVGALLLLLNPAISDFLKNDAPTLVHTLLRRTRRDQAQIQGRPRGRVLWAATERQTANRSHPETFICRVSRYDYNQPENRLLLYLLAFLGRCLKTTTRLASYVHTGEPSKPFAPQRESLANALAQLHQILPPGVELCTPSRITAAERNAAGRATITGYRRLSSLYGLCERLVLQPDREFWRTAYRQSGLLPSAYYRVFCPIARQAS